MFKYGDERSSNRYNNSRYEEHRPPFFKKYDLVRVIDFNSPLLGKFGLVAEILKNGRYITVVVKIGKYHNKMRLDQLRFCTRIDEYKASEFDNENDRRAARNKTYDRFVKPLIPLETTANNDYNEEDDNNNHMLPTEEELYADMKPSHAASETIEDEDIDEEEESRGNR